MTPRILTALALLAVALPTPAPLAAQKADRTMTPAEVRMLLDSVDMVMAFDAQDTGLPAVAHVKRRLVGRAEVTRYLAASFEEDESAKRLERSEVVLKKFGLLDRDFDLRPFLLSLLTEQVAGYYDPKTRTVNLLDWVPPAVQQPVLAHELTHAIQDQRVHLEKWSNSGFTGISRTVADDNARIRTDESETARQAVTEGQAMLVFTDYSQKQRAQPGAAAADDDSVTGSQDVMARAPLLLQKSLEFPYLAGMAFERALLAAGGRQQAFAGALDQPPTTSYEVLRPDAYLAHTPMPLLRLPDVHGLLDAEWDPIDVGAMGALDVDIMGSLFGGPEMGAALAPAWNGGVYYAAMRKGATAEQRRQPGSVGLLYYSRWRSPQAASTFAKLYAGALGRKVSGIKALDPASNAGDQVFTTAEGDVLVARSGSSVFIADGFPLATARKLQAATEAVQGSGRMQMAVDGPRRELSLGLGGALRGLMLLPPDAILRGTDPRLETTWTR